MWCYAALLPLRKSPAYTFHNTWKLSVCVVPQPEDLTEPVEFCDKVEDLQLQVDISY